MKIGIYSDIHISRNSSIIPLYLNDKQQYTTRLNMCYDSMIWTYTMFKNNNVDMIVNCGDTFNSHIVTSDEVTTFTNIINELYKPHNECDFPTVKDITLLGNHDKFNNTFNSMNLTKLTDYTQLVDKYLYLSLKNCDLYFISYYELDEFIENMLKMLNDYPKQHEKSILFMHGDINGSQLTGNKRIENHIGTDFLTKYFDIVINGHIHCHERIYNQNNKQIYNIGSLTTHSFADSNKHYGGCYILDTDTFEIKFFKNPYQILFRTYDIKSDDDEINLHDTLNNDKDLNVILKIKCDYNRKESINRILNDFKNILKHKYIFTYENNIKSNVNITDNVSASNDIKDEFITFLNNRTDLKGDISDYADIIK